VDTFYRVRGKRFRIDDNQRVRDRTVLKLVEKPKTAGTFRVSRKSMVWRGDKCYCNYLMGHFRQSYAGVDDRAIDVQTRWWRFPSIKEFNLIPHLK
jgi:hypothetical protein